MGTRDWNALQYILALARHHSLERAAAELAVDPSTVSRRVHALERSIGARVFDRTTGGHRLTPLGQRLLETAERVEADIAGMEREADRADQRLEGLVRVATSDAFGRHCLAGISCGFQHEHPEVELELVADVRPASLIQREVDVALRFVRPAQAQLASKRVAALGHGLYASPGYLATHPFSADGDLRGHRLLGYHASLASMPEAKWLDERASGARFTLRANRVDLLVSAAVDGLGLAVLPCYVADRLQPLVRLRGPGEVVTRDVWLVLHRDSRRIGRIRAFADYLAGRLEAQAALFRGAA